MAWENRMLEASFRGIVFDCLTWDDEGERNAVEHARPFVDGAELEDLGRGARRLRVKAIFFGDDYEERLEKFLKALDEPGAGDLVHPVFGPLKAQLHTWRAGHEADNVDAASLELTFAESALAKPLFSGSLSGQKAAKIGDSAGNARTGAAAVLAKAVAAGKNANALARAGLRSLAELKGSTSDVLTSGAGILSAPASWAADVASLVRGVVDLQAFGTASLVPDFAAVFTALTSAILLPSSGSSSSSHSSGGTVADAYPVTEGPELDVVQAHVELERALGVAEAAQAVLESEAETPTLSPVEIEAVASSSRELLQASIETYRELYPVEQHRLVTEPTKDVALAVQEAATAIIEARPPLVGHTLAARSCPRLVAHHLYGDHTRATEILRLNQPLRDPNFLTAGTVLHVYAR
ncbi:MAG: DNA circularization protein [Desulfovibrio sp.]|jgi:prophage DNA circulation protein